MQKNGQKPVSVSQNFLTGSRTIYRLIQKAGIEKTDYIVEIGAGKGHLTRALAETARHVCAYEIDRVLYQKCDVAKYENVKLFCGDFLKAKLPQRENYKVFSNIPFSITTQIIQKLTRAENPPQETYLIMEKGAAMRFCGNPRDSVQSLALKPFFQLQIVQDIPRREFHPMPSADIVMLKIVKRKEPELPVTQQEAYIWFLKTAHEKGICGKGGPLTKKQVSTALRRAGLSPLPALANMLYVQWLCLFRCYMQFHGNSGKGYEMQRENMQKHLKRQDSFNTGKNRKSKKRVDK